MKITIEQLDQGVLVTAEAGEGIGQRERAAFATAEEAIETAARVLGVGYSKADPIPPVARTPVAPTPDLNDENEQHEANAIIPPPATRRIGLSQPKKSLPPAGSRSRA